MVAWVCVFVFVPLNANELALPAPFSEEGRASRAYTPAYRNKQSHAHIFRNSQAVNFTSHSYTILTTTILFTIILVAREGSISENRQRQW